MTPITCAKPSPLRGRSPSSPTTRHVRSNIRSTNISMPSAILSNAASPSSSNSAASPPVSKRPLEITLPSSLSQPSSYGCDKCPHYLVRSQGRRDERDRLAAEADFLDQRGRHRRHLFAVRGARDRNAGFVEDGFDAGLRIEVVQEFRDQHAVLALGVVGDFARRRRSQDQRVVG